MSKKNNNKILNYTFLLLILTIGFPFQSLSIYQFSVESDYQIVNLFLGNGLEGQSIFSSSRTTVIPEAFASNHTSYPIITRGVNFETVQSTLHNFTTILGLPEYIERFDGVFIPYEYWEDSNHVTFNSADLSFVFNKNECSYTLYNDGRIFNNSTEIIKSDTWVVKFAENGTDNWQEVPQQSLNCTVEVNDIVEDTFQITYTKSDVNGTITNLMNKTIATGMKHIVSYTNNNPSWNNIKIGFSHILQGTPEHMSIITANATAGNSTLFYDLKFSTNANIPDTLGSNSTFVDDQNPIDISYTKLITNSTDGTMLDTGLDFHFVDSNKKQIHYDFDQGIEKLWNIRFLEELDGNVTSTKLYLDYMNDPAILPIGETTTIDPIVSASNPLVRQIIFSNGAFGQNCSNNGLGCVGSTITSTATMFVATNQWRVPIMIYDISSIPSNADVQEVRLGHGGTSIFESISRATSGANILSMNGEDFSTLTPQQMSDCMFVTPFPWGEVNPHDGGLNSNGGSGSERGDGRIGLGNPTSNPCGIRHISAQDSPTSPNNAGFTYNSGSDLIVHDGTGELSTDLEQRFLSLGLTSYTYMLCDYAENHKISGGTTASFRTHGITPCATEVGSGTSPQGALAVGGSIPRTDLAADKTLSFSASNVNTFLEITFVVLSQASAPISLTCTPISNTQVDLDWFPPNDLGGAAFIDGYRIERDSGGGFTNLVADTGSALTFFTDNTVVAGITFKYRVSALTGFGDGEVSSEVSCGVSGISNQVTDLTAQNQALGIVALDWTEPTFTGNEVITGYKIQRTTGTPPNTFSDWQAINHKPTTSDHDGVQVILNVAETTVSCTNGSAFERATNDQLLTIEGLCIGSDDDSSTGHGYLFKEFEVDDIKNRDIRILWEQFREQSGATLLNNGGDLLNVKWYIADGIFDMQGANVIQSGGDFEAQVTGTHVTGGLHIPFVGNGILVDCFDPANHVVNSGFSAVTQAFPLLSYMNSQEVHDVSCNAGDLTSATQDTVTVVFLLYDNQLGTVSSSVGEGAMVIDFIDVEGLGTWNFNDDLPNVTEFAYGHDNLFETNSVYNINNVQNPTNAFAVVTRVPDATYEKKGIEVKVSGSSIGQTVKHVSWDLIRSGAPTQEVFVEIWDSGADIVDPIDDILLAKSVSFITNNGFDGFIDTNLLTTGYTRYFFTLNTGVVLDTNDRIVLTCPDCIVAQGVPAMKTNPNTANSPLMPAGFGTTWLNKLTNLWVIFGGQNFGNNVFEGQIGHSASNSLFNGVNQGLNSIALVTVGDFSVGEGFITLVADTGNTNTEFLDSTVEENTTFGYRVFTLNSEGSSGASNVAIVTTAGAPVAPVILATPIGTTSINIDWTTPDLSGGVLVQYEIDRKIGVGGIFSFLDSTTNTEFDDGTGLFALQTATEYCYRVKTVTSVGSSSFSLESCATTFDAPSEVTNFVVTALDGSSVEMSFEDPASDGGSALIGFQIELKLGAGAFDIVQTSTSLNQARNDTGLPIGTLVTYKVTPFNQFGAGDSAQASDTTDATPQAPPNFTCSASSSTSITLDWETPATFTAPTGYQIDRRTVGGGFSTLVADTANTDTLFINGGLPVDSTFEYKILAHTPEGDTDFTTTIRCSTLSAPDFPPEDLQGDFTQTVPHQMVLAWDIPDTFGVPIISFRVERDDGAGYNEIASVSSSSFIFIDQDPDNDTSQKYRVFTVGSEGDSAPSIAIPFSANQTSHWHYEKTVDDTGDNKNAGLLTGTANFDNAGINGLGHLFDGSTYITVNNEEDYDHDNNVSLGITTYYRGNSTGVDQVLVSKSGTMSDTGYRMFIDSTGVLGVRITNTATSNELHVLGNTVLTDNSIHFLGFGYDGNNDESGLSLVVDGSFETKNVITNTLSNTILNDKPLVLGANDGGGNKLTGLLDDTRFFGTGTLDDATLQAVAEDSITTVIPIVATITIAGSTFADISSETPLIIMTSGYPLPTVDTIDLFNFTATNVNSQNVGLVIDGVSGQFILDPSLFNIMSSLSNYTAVSSLTNSEETFPLLSNFDLQTPVFTFTGDFFFQQQRNISFDKLSFNYTQTDIPFDLACNFKTALFEDGETVEFNGVFFVQHIQTVEPLFDVVVACIDQNTIVVDPSAPSFGGINAILSFVSFGDTTGVGNFLQFTSNYGDFFGVGLPFLFVIILAAAFTGRSAPTGILIIAIAIGIMWAMGILEINPFMWGIIIVLVILGVLGGKKFL